MEKLITKFQQTGICEVDVNKVSKAWNDKFSISQYDEKYTLVKQYRKNSPSAAKVQISKEQAEEIIKAAKLLPINSGIFRSAKTYRSESNIISEIKRIEQIQSEKQSELQTINTIVREYKTALTHKQ
jgi:hypothetical protein